MPPNSPSNGIKKGILPDAMIAALAEAVGFVPRTGSRPIRSSRRASICGWVRSPIACARAFCRGRARPLPSASTNSSCTNSRSTDGAVLETNCVYIVPLLESLALPDDVAASTNPKSSTGRLDVFTRVIADQTHGFDRIRAGYKGPLYAEIGPKTFPVLVREGSRLSQIRFRRGHAQLDAAGVARAARARAADRRCRCRCWRRDRGRRRSRPVSGRIDWLAIVRSATPA